MGGVVYQGLNYGSIPVVCDFLEIAASDRRGLFEDLRSMESAAKAVLNTRGDGDNG